MDASKKLLPTKLPTNSSDNSFFSLPTNQSLPQVQAKRAVNRVKNRCSLCLPFDHNRVKLLRHTGDTYQTDYINASYVDSYLRRRAYIIAQSPFNAVTAGDFWAMVIQCNVAQIVLLDNLIEGGVVKCTKYWPEVSTIRQGIKMIQEGIKYDYIHQQLNTPFIHCTKHQSSRKNSRDWPLLESVETTSSIANSL